MPLAGALAGVKVIDLTQLLAGPFCTQVLADHGADVIKVETPEGDLSRSIGAFRPEDAHKDFGGYFVSINRNKRSVVIDLKTAQGRAILIKLAAGADVLVENYRAGVMERLGLSFEALREANPRLVYASIRGFGDSHTSDSPYLDWPAFDVVAQAMGGIMGITGPDAATPTKIGPGVGDTVPGLYAAFGILAALRQADRSGRGQYVDVAMTDSVLAICERIVHQYSLGGVVAVPEGNRHPVLSPFGLFPARDGWVAIACLTDLFWGQLCELLGMPELAADPRFLSIAERRRHRDILEAELSARTAQLSKDELNRLLGGRIPFGPVLNAAEICADPHFRQRQMIVPMDYPGIDQPIEIAGVPVRLSETPGGVRMRAPRLGEHTRAVLREAGVPESEIEHCLSTGAIRQWAPKESV
jgi:crotonobetainyl-CoA:carnitine CoA-transferase CaiB-like acyl-CoA transferase